MFKTTAKGFSQYRVFFASLFLAIMFSLFPTNGVFAGLSDRILSIGISIQSNEYSEKSPFEVLSGAGQVDVSGGVLMPGAISLEPIREDRFQLASWNKNAHWNNSSGLLDSRDRLENVGKKVGEPLDLYSRFQIEVERSKFDVKLFAYDDQGKKDLLFSCKAGLGSSEYPTPRGSFYILRIFDDHPLWIPPQDREWAYGQSPSRSVYGGHMMPFFSKIQASKLPLNDDADTEIDAVAPQMKMVDMGAYRIHGTDSPWSVGSAQSHGCVRLVNSSVAQLADTLKMYVGTTTRGESPNGVFINLAKPVKIILY